MFGLIGTIIGWMGYQLGLRTDAASSSGSLHAKTKDIKDYLTGTLYSYISTNLYNRITQFKSFLPLFVSGSAGGSYEVTMLSVSGAGFLTGVFIQGYSANFCGNMRINIDGTNRFNGNIGLYLKEYSIACLHRYNTSLGVYITPGSGEGCYYTVSYIIE